MRLLPITEFNYGMMGPEIPSQNRYSQYYRFLRNSLLRCPTTFTKPTLKKLKLCAHELTSSEPKPLRPKTKRILQTS